MQIKLGWALLGCMLFLVAVGTRANATFTIDMQQVGPDVIATGFGTIDTAGLEQVPGPAHIWGNVYTAGGLEIGPASTTTVDVYNITPHLPNLVNFGLGSGVSSVATTGAGDMVGVGPGIVVVPQGYVSGDALSDMMTFAGSTFTSLGIAPGTYSWAWGEGLTQDSLVLNAGLPVPEPASIVMIAGGLLVTLPRRRAIQDVARQEQCTRRAGSVGTVERCQSRHRI